MYSFILWIPALLALFSMLRPQMPIYAVLGALMAIYGCIAGGNFGMERIYLELFQAHGGGNLTADAMRDSMGIAAVLALLLPGSLFPLNILVLAIVLSVKKIVPLLVTVLMAVGAIAFPIARILDIKPVAQVGDIILLLPMVWIGWMYLTRSDFPQAASEG